jgi:hypothetical protein
MNFRQERQMKASIAAGRGVSMAQSSLARIEYGRGAWVHVWNGSLWITQEGDRRDYLVEAGDSFEIARNGVTLIHALRRSIVTLDAPGASRQGLARLWSRCCARLFNPTPAAL